MDKRYTALLQQFTEPKDIVKILNNIFVKGFVKIQKTVYEHLCGASVLIDIELMKKRDDWFPNYYTFLIHIQHTIGEDYPSILRKMREQKKNYLDSFNNKQSHKIKQILYYKKIKEKVNVEKLKVIFQDVHVIQSIA